MQTPTVPAPPIPLFGILTFGFVLIAIYVLVRISKEGAERFISCKKTIIIGFLVFVIITIIETVNYWIWLSQHEAAYPFPAVIASLILSILFILIPLIDLGVQWFRLRK